MPSAVHFRMLSTLRIAHKDATERRGSLPSQGVDFFFFKCNASFIILKSNLLRPQCCPSPNPKRNKLRETPAQPYKSRNVEQNQMAGL